MFSESDACKSESGCKLKEEHTQCVLFFLFFLHFRNEQKVGKACLLKMNSSVFPDYSSVGFPIHVELLQIVAFILFTLISLSQWWS